MTGMNTDPHAMGESLRGLALGDGFGERWFRHKGRAAVMIEQRQTPTEEPFRYSDDTVMALSIVRTLLSAQRISQRHLAELFGATYVADPYRRYGAGMTDLLPRLHKTPDEFATYARELFGGAGSLGNGSAMRVAPLGAFFHEDMSRVVEEAALSAEVTHAHPEAIDGAIAVAVAAALAAASRGKEPLPAAEFLGRVAELVPVGVIRAGVEAAADFDSKAHSWMAAEVLGNGSRIRCSDTVPFALWTAAVHLDDYESAMWATAAGLGDVDTTCAITGGIVAARTGIAGAPRTWLELREPLPEWTDAL